MRVDKMLPRLSTKLNKEDYVKFKNKQVRFRRWICEVKWYRSENRVGSYERGVAWTHREYGCLIRGKGERRLVSVNHGKDWFRFPDWVWFPKEAVANSKNKVILGDSLTKELAFEGIQQLNRRDFGPGYRWRK